MESSFLASTKTDIRYVHECPLTLGYGTERQMDVAATQKYLHAACG
jgi:hypothetical protein